MLNGTNRETLTVKQAGEVIGLGRGAMYRAIRRNEIGALRIGKLLLVPRREIDRLLDSAGTNREVTR